MKITLQKWAETHYSPAPTPWVLAKWRRAGQIHPLPEKVGREWYVEESAERMTFERPRASLVDRISARKVA